MNIAALLEPTIDYVFKRIFGHVGNEKITAGLLSDILGEQIEDINLDCNTFLDKDITDDKIGILDVKAKFKNGTTCDIEIQVVEQSSIIKRLLFYWSKMYIQNIQSGKDYNILKKCIVILIADFEIDSLSNINQYLTKWELRDKKYGKHVLTDLLEICIIELPKMNKYQENQGLDNWVKFIKNPEVVDMENKETNEAIREAKKVLVEISNDERERELADLRMKYIMDQKAIEDSGIEKGIKQGIEQGKKEEKEKIAKKMLMSGMNMETIMDLLDLSKEEIEKIK